MSTAIPQADWSQLERQSRKKQREYFKSVRDKFISVPVSDAEKNVQKGDNLVFPRSLYDHHGICIGHEGEQPVIAEYTGPSSTISGSSRVLSCSDSGALGIVKNKTYTYEELEKQEVYKRIWPKFLVRYDSVDEIVSRAKRRLGEQTYGVLENNCEHFVSWCMCDLNVSLQVNARHFCLSETFYLVLAVVVQVIEMIPDIIFWTTQDRIIMPLDNMTDAVLVSWRGFCFGAALEGVWAFYGIVKALCEQSKGIYKARKRNEKVVEVVLKGLGRLVGGIGGSLAGSAVGTAAFPLASYAPHFGSPVGRAIGTGLGHLLGFGISWSYKSRSASDPERDPLLHAENV